jgi:purine-nucleoside phosphorylase
MSTPHNRAEKGDIADVVLMPGDPLRAKHIADEYLESAVQFNDVRGMFGYTGIYRGERVSVMGSGMGIPSIGIYSHELYSHYDVDAIIRIGSAGALADNIALRDVVIAQGACTDSNYASQFNIPGTFAPIADYSLLSAAVESTESLGLRAEVGNVLSSDAFYNADDTVNDRWKRMGVLAVEMEAAGLYLNAASLGKKALCITTISDHLYRDEKLSAHDRQTGFDEMIKIALETAYKATRGL